MTDLEVSSNVNVISGFNALEAPDTRSKAVSDQPLGAGVSGTATLKEKVGFFFCITII